jgi:hypothetical protein
LFSSQPCAAGCMTGGRWATSEPGVSTGAACSCVPSAGAGLFVREYSVSWILCPSSGCESKHREHTRTDRQAVVTRSVRRETLSLTCGSFKVTVSIPIYRVSQQEMSIFREVIVSAILSKNNYYIYICTCVLFRKVSETELFQCTDEQYAMSSLELQSALMLTVEFSKMYYTK